MIIYPTAKLNLGLNVLYKRDDGFHEIETCFIPTSLSDILEFKLSDTSTTFESTGIEISGNTKNNICVQAWELLHEKYSVPPIKLHLHKIIPVGAGLGGGSADAAFLLKGLSEFFKLNISVKELQHLASLLGSDCSFFIQNISAIGTGRGEQLETIELDLSSYKILIINPGIHISTQEAYSSVSSGPFSGSLKELLKQPVESWMGGVKNDFEPGIFKKYPDLEKIKRKLIDSGASYAAMSGSGSTMFGLFKNQIPEKLKTEYASYFVYAE